MKRFSQDNGDLLDAEGRVMPCAEAQEKIRQSIERTGRFILGSNYEPQIGQVAQFAGLPFRVVRFVSREELEVDAEKCRDLWGPSAWSVAEHYFEVEVAD